MAEQIDLAVRFGLEPEGNLIASKLVPLELRVVIGFLEAEVGGFA